MIPRLMIPNDTSLKYFLLIDEILNVQCQLVKQQTKGKIENYNI